MASTTKEEELNSFFFYYYVLNKATKETLLEKYSIYLGIKTKHHFIPHVIENSMV